jgi:CubicO group peptidase (beta-lactamase class C family)
VLDSTFLQACEDAAARFEVPALAVGTASADGTIELHAVGCELETRFRIASITKPMTAALAVSLLDLDAPTGVWPDDVRVRHLLSHMSGFDCELGGELRFGDGDDALDAAVEELPTVDRLVAADTAWSYANTGYWLAGWLAAESAGSTFEDALREHVLGPAGMANAGFDAPDLPGSGPGATTDPYPRARRPSGGVVTDIGDVVRFGRWLSFDPGATVLRRPLGKPVTGVYGLGLFGQRVGGVEIWGHPGSAFGFQSSLLVAPGPGAVFAGLSNSGNGSRALTELEELWLERVTGSRRERRDTVELPPEVLDGFAGTYANGELEAVVAAGGHALTARVTMDGDELEIDARAIGPRRFEVVGGPFDGDRFDFPLDGFGRFGSRLARRVV